MWDFLGGLFGYASQERTNVANAKQAQQQMDFQKSQSDTAIRRRMADLKAGGLNPILAAGDAASSSAGAMARMEDPGAKALLAGRQKQEMDNMQQDWNLKQSQMHAADKAGNLSNAMARSKMAEMERARMDHEIMQMPFFKSARASNLYMQQLAPLITATGSVAGALLLLKKFKFLTKPSSGGKGGFTPAVFNKLTGELR